MAVAKTLRTDFITMVRRFVDAVNRHDIEGLKVFYAEDAVAEVPGIRLEGRKAIFERREQALRAFPDLSVAYRHQFAAGSHGVVEWTARGTHTATLETPLGSIPPTGKCVEWTGVTIWEIDRDGLIVRERVYPDAAGLLRRLGILKPF